MTWFCCCWCVCVYVLCSRFRCYRLAWLCCRWDYCIQWRRKRFVRLDSYCLHLCLQSCSTMAASQFPKLLLVCVERIDFHSLQLSVATVCIDGIRCVENRRREQQDLSVDQDAWHQGVIKYHPACHPTSALPLHLCMYRIGSILFWLLSSWSQCRVCYFKPLAAGLQSCLYLWLSSLSWLLPPQVICLLRLLRSKLGLVSLLSNARKSCKRRAWMLPISWMLVPKWLWMKKTNRAMLWLLLKIEMR